ncbi:MAG: hypothetical protein ACE14V_07385 [bacterium]
MLGLSLLLIGIALAISPTIKVTGSGTVLVGDARTLSASGGTPPYTWSIKTGSGAPGILNAYTGTTVVLLATVDPGTCSIVITDATLQSATTEDFAIIPAPSPIKSFWIWSSSISTRSDATTVITTATTHQVRDVFLLVKGASGSVNFTVMDWLTSIAAGLTTNVRIHPWVICFKDSTKGPTGIYQTVGPSSTWIVPMDTSYRQYLMDTCFTPLLRDHPNISGIHLDCYRYPGSYTYPECNAINNDTGRSLFQFCQQIATTIRVYNPSLPISIAVMPEMDTAIYYYGQDYYQLSTAGCRILCPMAYTGNYGTTAEWVGQVMKYTRDTAVRTCAVYAGEQFTYDSGPPYYMTSAEIAAETRYTLDSGAQGVTAFRWPVQSNQWIAWDTVGTTLAITFSPSTGFNVPVGSSIVIGATGGWKPFARWTTSNWSVGTVAVFFSDDSIRFYARNTGTCTVMVTDSAPGPRTISSATITIIAVPVELSRFDAILEPNDRSQFR